jgi:hypothetical protein
MTIHTDYSFPNILRANDKYYLVDFETYALLQPASYDWYSLLMFTNKNKCCPRFAAGVPFADCCEALGHLYGDAYNEHCIKSSLHFFYRPEASSDLAEETFTIKVDDKDIVIPFQKSGNQIAIDLRDKTINSFMLDMLITKAGREIPSIDKILIKNSPAWLRGLWNADNTSLSYQGAINLRGKLFSYVKYLVARIGCAMVWGKKKDMARGKKYMFKDEFRYKTKYL